MQIQDIQGIISNAIRRGTTQDANILIWIQKAADRIEKQWSFEYMKKFGTAVIDPTAPAPNRVAFPNNRVKSWLFVRYDVPAPPPFAADYQNGYVYLRGVDALDVSRLDYGNPSGYWKDSGSYLVLDSIPTSQLTLEMQWYEYTAWPTDVTAEPTLAAIGWDFLSVKALEIAAIDLKDPTLQPNAQQAQEALAALVNADQELKHQDVRYAMTYVPPHAHHVPRYR